jgi:hypothetical protein
VCFDTQSPKTQTYGISYNGATDILYAFNNLKDNLTGAFTSASGDTRAHFIGNIESAAVDNVIKSASKSHIAATDTEIGLALPIAENTSEAIAISGTVNNRAVGVNHVLNVTSAGSTPQLTGLVARAGTRVFVKNNSGVSFNIMHQSASSTDVNRIIMKAGADLTMTSGQMRGFYYFGNRWHEV